MGDLVNAVNAIRCVVKAMIAYLREYDDYTLIGEAVARDLARQRIRYVEGFFSPPDYRRSTLDPQPVTEALRTGVNRVRSIEVAPIERATRSPFHARRDPAG